MQSNFSNICQSNILEYFPYNVDFPKVPPQLADEAHKFIMLSLPY